MHTSASCRAGSAYIAASFGPTYIAALLVQQFYCNTGAAGYSHKKLIEIPKCTHMCSCSRNLIVFLNWLQTAACSSFRWRKAHAVGFLLHGANLPHRSDAHMCVHHYCSKTAAPMMRQCMVGPLLQNWHTSTKHTHLQQFYCSKTDAHQPRIHICSSYMQHFWCMAAAIPHTW